MYSKHSAHRGQGIVMSPQNFKTTQNQEKKEPTRKQDKTHLRLIAPLRVRVELAP